MKQLLEFIPLVLFFVTYKLAGVRDAAIVLVIATIIQLIVLKWKYSKIENIYISHNMSEEAWVDFKSFGILGMTVIATLISGAYIYRYLPKDKTHSKDGEK